MDKKTYSTSYQTKKALAGALKELMAQKPFEKITIRDITERCGIRRQNFYYHFEDAYALMQWMFQEEAVSLLEKREGTKLWQEGLLQLFQYLEENKAVCLCALKSVGREHLKRFFQQDIDSIIRHTVSQIGEELDQGRNIITSKDIEFMTRIHVLALAGVMESWLLGEFDYTPEQMVHMADLYLQDHIRGAKMRLHCTDSQ